MQTDTVASRLLDVIEREILPMTERAVTAGNKGFGTALLRKSDLSVVIAGTDGECDNPLLHAAVGTLNRFYELADRPATRDLIFLSTHEPCPLCLSAITLCGFDNFYCFFSYKDSRDAFDVPNDVRILEEVFGVDGGHYRASNAYWTSHSIPDLVNGEPEPQRDHLLAQEQRIRVRYAELSDQYQLSEADNDLSAR